jgi:hypothetical protein
MQPTKETKAPWQALSYFRSLVRASRFRNGDDCDGSGSGRTAT